MRAPDFLRRSARLRLSLVIMLTGSLAVVGSALASNRFADVPSGHTFHDDIDALANAGITSGCGGGNYCPGDPVNRGQMAGFLSRAAALRKGRFPVALAKSDSQTYCALAARHPESLPATICGPSVATLAATGPVSEVDVAIGIDHLPIISFGDPTANDLKVAHCSDPGCTHPPTITSVQSFDDRYSSIAIGTDGLAVISHYDDTNHDLQIRHCSNVRCTASTGAAPNGFQRGEGRYTSIAIGTDGVPIVSYYDLQGDLEVAHCSNVACTSTTNATKLDTVGDVGYYTSIAIGTDGLPVISYYDETNDDLKVAHCADVACTATTNVTALDTAGSVGQYTAIAIGTDGLPVISYYDATNRDLKVAHCANVACTTTTHLTPLDSAGDVGEFTSIAIGIDGLPVISYRDFPDGAVRLARCANLACTTTAGPPKILHAGGDFAGGSSNSVAIGIDGVPVVAFHDAVNHNVKAARAPVI